MSSCPGGPAGLFPDPNQRAPGGRAYQYNNPRGGSGGGNTRRPTYFNRYVHRASAVIQDPRSISLRELALALFAIFALYHAFFALRDARQLVFRRPVAEVCVGLDGASCLVRYIWAIWYFHVGDWAAAVVPWGVVAAVTVFGLELAVGSIRGTKR